MSDHKNKEDKGATKKDTKAGETIVPPAVSQDAKPTPAAAVDPTVTDVPTQ